VLVQRIRRAQTWDLWPLPKLQSFSHTS